MSSTDMLPPVSKSAVRQCANIKSQKTPDVKCPLNATYGDYCSRHWKHPRRFYSKEIAKREVAFTPKEIAAAKKIQRAWRAAAGWLRAFHQGPGAANRAASCNDTEFFSLDPIQSIPVLYYFSFVGANNTLWSFDIRSLGKMVMMGELKENPYTREAFSEATLGRIHARLTWLRKRRYSVVYPAGTDLTAEQIWNQRVLDLFLRMESFGFHVSCDWFHGLSVEDHEEFYRVIFNIWYSRLGLTAAQREAIVPGCETAATRLFRFMPQPTPTRHSKAWWERCNLAIIEAFLTRSQDKEQQRLGALYSLMGLVWVCDEAAESFPWLLESIDT